MHHLQDLIPFPYYLAFVDHRKNERTLLEYLSTFIFLTLSEIQMQAHSFLEKDVTSRNH